jgi:hypothetical protein
VKFVFNTASGRPSSNTGDSRYECLLLGDFSNIEKVDRVVKGLQPSVALQSASAFFLVT